MRASGNLDRRGIGDVHTLTVSEYRAMSGWGRFWYRVYRHPIVLFGLGPSYLFFVQNRYPFSVERMGAKYWISAMGTNLAIVVGLGIIWYFGGLMPLLLVFFPTVLVAASVGVWLFYVQHQFEETHWDRDEDWQVHDAALEGSSNYDLPRVLRWFTGNIGIHHVHHLYARIPFYRLPQVLRDHPELAEAQTPDGARKLGQRPVSLVGREQPPAVVVRAGKTAAGDGLTAVAEIPFPRGQWGKGRRPARVGASYLRPRSTLGLFLQSLLRQALRQPHQGDRLAAIAERVVAGIGLGQGERVGIGPVAGVVAVLQQLAETGDGGGEAGVVGGFGPCPARSAVRSAGWWPRPGSCSAGAGRPVRRRRRRGVCGAKRSGSFSTAGEPTGVTS